jgi:hypothetical protein
MWRGSRSGIQRSRESYQEGWWGHRHRQNTKGTAGARRHFASRPYGRRFLSVKHCREYLPNFPI